MGFHPAQFASRVWKTPRLRFRLLLVLGGFFVFGLALALGVWFNVCNYPVDACPSVGSLDAYEATQAPVIYAADGRVITEMGTQHGGTRRKVVSLKEMSPALIGAFLAAEDQRFFSHGGVDWIRLFGSIRMTLLGRKQGFSTITMQLARNLWPDKIDRREREGFKGITRKLREIRVALEIERRYSKERILELYLNQILLGDEAYGVEAASERYFGKHSSDVNVAEAATLAALPKAPNGYNPRVNPAGAIRRRNLILKQLEDWGKLSKQSASAWKAYPLELSPRSDFSEHGQYAVEYIRQWMAQQPATFPNLYTGGYRVYTTIDLDIQAAAERALKSRLAEIEEDQYFRARKHLTYRKYLEQNRDDEEATQNATPYLQGAIISVEPKTGYIRAMVGGRDFNDSKFNRAVQAKRQAGSTFKLFLYTAALRAGYRWSDVFEDAPIDVPTGDTVWQPKNYEDDYAGMMTMRTALTLSKNTVAVRIGQQVGIDAVRYEAENLGVTTEIPEGYPSIFIGSAEVTLLDLANAYATVSALGQRAQPTAILRVEDKSGNIIWTSSQRPTQAMDPALAWLVISGLRDVVWSARGTAGRVGSALAAARLSAPLPSAGKTGTTNDGMDVWYAGITPDLSTVVWIGFDQKQVISSNAGGGRLAAPAWADMMIDVYRRRKIQPYWPRPDGIEEVTIDPTTGGTPNPYCLKTIQEFFLLGTAPRTQCPINVPHPMDVEPQH